MWASGDFRDGRLDRGLGVALTAVGGWATFWRIVFAVTKCEAILFRGRRVRIERPFEARLGGELIPHARAVRYLGIWFDETLMWSRHIREVTTTATSRLWALRRYIGRHQGLDTYIFTSIVRRALLP